MPKIVINTCYGGFGLSRAAWAQYCELRVWDPEQRSQHDIPRDDPLLVEIVERLGIKANGHHSDLKVVAVPDDVKWTVEEYDGAEWVAEVHRTWS